MNRYELQNALFKLDGYYLPKPNKNDEDSFEDAKKELIKNINAEIKRIESIPFKQFIETRRLYS